MNDPITNSTTQTQDYIAPAPVAAPEKKSSGFGRVLGGIMGGALNIVAPGLGSVIGGAIGGGGASAADMQTMMNNQMRQSMQLLSVQNRVQSQSQEFTTMSNLLKSKHDSEMSAVNNFKS
jgi:predicted lipid-binding transport protein (Tim44 family)